MAREMDLQKPWIGGYTAVSSLCLCQRFRTVHVTGYGSAQEKALTSLQIMYFCY